MSGTDERIQWVQDQRILQLDRAEFILDALVLGQFAFPDEADRRVIYAYLASQLREVMRVAVGEWARGDEPYVANNTLKTYREIMGLDWDHYESRRSLAAANTVNLGHHLAQSLGTPLVQYGIGTFLEPDRSVARLHVDDARRRAQLAARLMRIKRKLEAGEPLLECTNEMLDVAEDMAGTGKKSRRDE